MGKKAEMDGEQASGKSLEYAVVDKDAEISLTCNG